MSHQPVWNPVLISWPPSTQRSSTDYLNCAKSLHASNAHHHPHPKEIKNYRTKWLQACGSNVCGHEVIWKTGAGPPEGHHWTLAGSSSVCLQSKSVDDAVSMGLHYVLQHLDQGSPTLLLESYRPTDFSSNPNQTHLNQLIMVFKATC